MQKRHDYYFSWKQENKSANGLFNQSGGIETNLSSLDFSILVRPVFFPQLAFHNFPGGILG